MEPMIESLPFEEIDAIEPLWRALIESNAANSPYFADYYRTFSFPVRKGFLTEKVLAGGAVETWMVRDGERGPYLGFCTITYQRESGSGEVEMLYLSESCRGRGLGSQLLKLALDRFSQLQITDRKLCVTYGNEAALRLYQKFGFYPFTVDCLQRPE